ncbi:hypothetical protein [Rubritalea marina]|uniref:hypothetical protein n=1 Tax=Rubritalea marina TaxID=361055 RepID=UPI0003601AD6|nr:hypothetical protein [Rubritalea marina]
MAPSSLLTLLLCGAAVLGGVLYSQKHGEVGAGSRLSELKRELELAEAQIAELRDHNARLKALVLADAPVDLPEGVVQFVASRPGASVAQQAQAFIRSREILEEAASQYWLLGLSLDALLARNYAMEALGVLPEMSDWQGILTALTYRGAMVVFDPSAGELLLDERFDDGNVHHLAQLVHALAVAALWDTVELSDRDDTRMVQVGMVFARASQLSQQFYTEKSRALAVPLQAAGASQVELGQQGEGAKLPVMLERFFRDDCGKWLLANPTLESWPLSTQAVLAGTSHEETGAEIEPLPDAELTCELGVMAAMACVPEGQEAWVLEAFQGDQLSIAVDVDEQLFIQWSTRWRDPSSAARFVEQLAVREHAVREGGMVIVRLQHSASGEN